MRAPRRAGPLRTRGRVAAGYGVSFVIPAYNEAATIGRLLERIDALALDAQVIVDDDGSRDRTADIAARGR